MYPWGGQEYKAGFANVNQTEKTVGSNNLQQTLAVGMYPQGASPFGVEEMSGNVWGVLPEQVLQSQRPGFGAETDLRAAGAGRVMVHQHRRLVLWRPGATSLTTTTSSTGVSGWSWRRPHSSNLCGSDLWTVLQRIQGRNGFNPAVNGEDLATELAKSAVSLHPL